MKIINNLTKFFISERLNFNIIECVNISISFIQNKGWNRTGKCKTVSLQAWRGSEDSRSLRFPDFKTIGT